MNLNKIWEGAQNLIDTRQERLDSQEWIDGIIHDRRGLETGQPDTDLPLGKSGLWLGS